MTIALPMREDDPLKFRHVELEINTACDLACFGCDRLSDVASRGVPNMTVAQVARFVDESLELGWRWERIRLLGGEPTLHPQFREIASELLRYRANPVGENVFLQVLSNGLGRLDRHKAWLLEHRIDPHCETKQKGVEPAWFNNTRIVPVDRDPNVGELPPCGIFGPRGCGIGLTAWGFFLDGAGASIARVVGHDIGVQSLRDVTWQSMLEQAKILCRICGHWNPDSGPLVTRKVSETGKLTGKFWTDALAKYAQHRPKMTRYGGENV